MVRLATLVAGFVLLLSEVHAQDSNSFRLELILQGTLEGGQTVVNDFANRIRFEEDALIAWDQHDGSKFIPLQTPYSLLSPEGIRNGQPKRQSVRSLPSGLADEYDQYTVPLAFKTTDPGTFTISAVEVDIPNGWSFTLRDMETSLTVNLLDDTHDFEGVAADTAWQERFEIDIVPAPIVADEEGPASFRLSNVAPNPASETVHLSLRVDEAQRVTARVYDAVGRLVSTVHDSTLAAGVDVRLEIDTSEYAAGAYVVRVEGETFAESRRLAVVR